MKKFISLALIVVMSAVIITGCRAEENPQRPEETPQPQVVYYQNPLTGYLQEEDYPQGVRPIAVMVNNILASDTTERAWPHYGLSSADAIFEMETEGGITRYMALFRDRKKMGVVGPIRSARDRFVQMMLPYDCLYVHDGSSTYAKTMLENYRYENKSLQSKQGVTYRDYDLAPNKKIEHTEFTNGKLIMDAISDEQLNIDAYKEPVNNLFKWVKYDRPERVLNGIDVSKIYWHFSNSYAATMSYNSRTGTYTKEHRNLYADFSKPLIDRGEGNKPVEFDNVFVLWTQIDRYPESILAKVDLSWGGVGYYFNGGKVEKVRWMKGNPNDPLRIVSLDGSERDIEINPGKSYIAIVDLDYFGTFSMDDKVVDVAGDYKPVEETTAEEGVESKEDIFEKE